MAVTEASRATRRRRSAASALVLGAVLLLTAVTLAVTSGTTTQVLPFVPVQLACVAVGALIVARRSHNLVGTLFLLFGLLGSAALVTTALAETTIAPEWAGWWSMIWVELALPLLMLAMQAFPAGRPMPGIWTRIFWATLSVGLLGCLITGLSDVNFHNNFSMADPVTLLPAATMEPIYATYQMLSVLTLLLSVVSLGVRFRRANTDVRLQIKWVLTALAMLAIAVVVCLVLNVEPVIAFIVCAPLIPIAVGIAITRHGLYEIDRVISRTLAYASVTGAVIAVYVVLVTTITRLVPSSSSVAVTVATLSAAAVFQPLLRRVRASVDRRFDRAHYDLAETVAVFGGSLEQTVDLDDVLTDLHSVLTRTLQPARLNVWLQSHGERTL